MLSATLFLTIIKVHLIYALPINRTKIYCNEKINGSIGDYTFINNFTDNGVYVQFDTCQSPFHTELYLYNDNEQEIISCVYCSGDCSGYQLNLPIKLYESEYILEIRGHRGEYYLSNEFVISINCDSNTSFASNQPCHVDHVNGTYICECIERDQCAGDIIGCQNDMDCHLKCNANYACNKARVIWPTNGTGTIECNGDYACHNINFPQPPPNNDLVVTCNSTNECRGAQIICPTHAKCEINCLASESCYYTTIYWSNELVESILSCPFEAKGCKDTTTPPKYYQFTFNDTYDLSEYNVLTETLLITEQFEIYFNVKLQN
eukprot:311882_1